MKKTIKSLLAIAVAAFAFTACSDVPEPYDIPGTSGGGGTGSEIYSSTNFKTGWILKSITPDQAWSQGNSYVQATGYQKWDGAESKSNRAVKSWLVSPSINTTGHENVKFKFDNTIKYTNNVSGWEAYHKVYATSNYNESDISASTWVELDFKPVSSPYSDWTLYTSGEIQLPASLVGKESIRFGFYFEAPSNASTTWELMNFVVEDGIANNEPEPEPQPEGEVKAVTIDAFIAASVSTTDWYQLTGTIKNLKDGDQYGNFDIEDATGSVYVYGLTAEKGGESKKFQELVAAKGIANGKKITIIGNRGEYNKKIEVLNAYFVSIEGEATPDPEPQPTGDTDGSEAKPYTVADAIAAASGTEKYVKAYIVGWIDGQVLSSGAHFDGNATVASNILIADSPDETDVAKCMPVQLPSGAVRTAVNLKDKPDNYKKEILLNGNIEKYFGVPGIKSTGYAKIGDTEAGTKPGGSEGGEQGGGGDTPPSGDAQAVTIAQFNAAAVSNDVWYQLTGTISNLKDGDKYGNFDLTDETGSVYVYGLLSEKGGAKQKFQDLVTAKGVANGKKITIIGNRGEYQDKIEVVNAYFVSIE